MTEPGPVLLVDLGGVLFEFDHDHRLAVLGKLLTMPPARVHELLWASGFSADCDAGRYDDAAAVRAEIRRITGYSGSDADLDVAWCSAFTPDSGVLDLVRSAGPPCGVFTNNGPLEEEVLTTMYPAAFSGLRHHFFCHRLVANKPTAAVYRQVAELLGVPPSLVRFADDSEANVRAAVEAGWRAVRHRSPADFATLLR